MALAHPPPLVGEEAKRSDPREQKALAEQLDFRGLLWSVSRDRLTRQFLTESPPSDQEALRRAAHGAMRRI